MSSPLRQRCTAVEGCPCIARRGGVCWGHVRQKQKGHAFTPLDPRKMSFKERLRIAALAYAAAETEEDWWRADCRLDMAAMSLAVSRIAPAAYGKAGKKSTAALVRAWQALVQADLRIEQK